MKDLVQIGIINKVSGFKGKLSCIVNIAHPERLLKQKFLFVILEGLPVPFFVEEIEFKNDDLLVKFEDVETEADAKKLVRKEIFSERIKVQKKKDVLTWNDLKGYNVIDEVHGELGIIEDVQEFPKQMIAKCMMNEKEILFPLNDEIVVEIDDDQKIVYVDLPDGLLDIYLE